MPFRRVYTVFSANTKIIAEDGKVWGLISVTTRRVNTLIKEVEERAEFNEIEKAALLDILNRWKVKDFSQAVDDHNYVWDKLRGTVGRAIKLRK